MQEEQTQPAGLLARIAARMISARSVLSALAVVLIAGLAAFTLSRVTQEIRYDDVTASLAAIGPFDIALSLGFTALSFAALAGYDLGALAHIRRRLPLPEVLTTSFAAYAIGNILGFGPLSGGAVRFRAYTRLGLSPGEISRIVAYVTLSFTLGLVALCALSTLAIAPQVAVAVGWSAPVLQAGAAAVLALLAGLFLAARRGRPLRLFGLQLRLPDSRTASRQFLVSAADLAASASVLYVLIPSLHMSWPVFFAIYAAAVGLGILSHIPGGLGVFEAIMLAGLGQRAGVDDIVGGLVAYRLIYHVLPLIVAVAILTTTELSRIGETPLGATLRQAGLRLAPPLMAASALILGAILVFSGVTPTPDETLDALGRWLPLPIVEASHFLASCIGLVLFVTARGLARRLDGAWLVAMVGSVAALVFSLLKSVAVIQAGLLGLFVVALLANRRVFNRPASLMRQALGPQWLAGMAVLLIAATGILLFVYQDTAYSHVLWWQFEMSNEVPRSLRALLGTAILAAMAAIYSLLAPSIQRPPPLHPEELARALSIIDTQDDADANLVRMGDKNILVSASGEAFLMYGQQGRSWIALLDPIGREEDFPELVWQFIELATASGGRPVFYQISTRLLPHIADAGLRACKLGERAVADLTGFSLSGRRAASLRSAQNRGQRDGFEIAIIPSEEVAAVVAELRAVSDAWLEQHRVREKRFSLGMFSEDYVCAQPVAVLRREGRILAFATLMTTATKVEATVDLMRFAPDAPPGAMDMLFIGILEAMKAAGFQRFNLGMAPLSGLGRHELAPVWDQIGGAVFDHGEKYYNFKGVRAFKSKFHPRWEPRYLAAPNGGGVAVALMDVTLLIGGGLKGVIGR